MSFARMLSGLTFIILGLSQIFQFKAVHEKVVAHFQALSDSTVGIFHGLYLFFENTTPLWLVLSCVMQMIVGISLVFSYRIKWIGRFALVFWIIWLFLYYPFYLIPSPLPYLIDFCFGLFQVLILLFCLKIKKRPIERHVQS